MRQGRGHQIQSADARFLELSYRLAQAGQTLTREAFADAEKTFAALVASRPETRVAGEGEGEGEGTVVICDNCFAAFPNPYVRCFYCGPLGFGCPGACDDI